MAYINKIVVNGSEVNANQLEGILDKDGHARFVEGAGTTTALTGFEFTYARWSLSGTHLMLVLAGNVEANTSLADNTDIVTFAVPSWVLDKIVTFRYESVAILPFTVRETSTVQHDEFNCTLTKHTSNLRIANVGGAQTIEHGGTFRIQFDLIIDNA